MAKIALSLPYSNFTDFYKRLGFGQRSAVKFQLKVVVNSSHQVNGNVIPEVATMAYGYGTLNATVLQMVDALCHVGYKGVKIPLSLYKLDAPPVVK